MQTLWQDLRYGARMLMKQPGFTLIAVITLALGIGANTAIFSVVNAVLLRPLPYPEPAALARIYEKETDAAAPSERLEVAPANFLDWRRQSRTLVEIAAWGQEEQALASQDHADSVVAAFVSANFFSVLGVSPLHGRVFTSEEDKPGSDTVALLGYGLWQRRFGGDPNVVGQRVNLDGSQYTVLGIMPAGFQYPRGAEIWTPLALNANQTQMRDAHFLQVIARRRPDASLAQVRVEMETIAGSLARQYPATNKHWTVNVVPLLEDEVGQARTTMLMLMSAVGLVLLIACANVSSLLIARGAMRRAEITIRSALGASRWRIARQLLTESVLLAGLGGGLGLLLALWGTDALLALSPSEIPRLQTARVDLYALWFTLAVTVLAGLIFGMLPALQAARIKLHESLKEGGRGASGSLANKRIFGALVVSEIALALIVLVGAGLLLNSFMRLRRVEIGIQTTNLLTVEVNLPSSRYRGKDYQAHRLNFYGQVIERIGALPGVAGVGAIDSLPLGGHERGWTFRKEGQTLAPSERQVAGFQIATTDYFRAMGMQIRRGRAFAESDRDGSPQVAIINESFARQFYPNEDPLGQRIIIRNRPAASEIVGVVNDIRHFGPDKAPGPEMYVPYNQLVVGAVPLVVRTTSEPEALIGAVRQEIRAVDREVAIGKVRTMTQMMSATLAERRFALLLLGGFAALAQLLAAVGVYGVMSYAVTQRTREIAVRMALGAQTSDALRLIIKQGMSLALIGVAGGLVGAFALTRLMEKLLFGVGATDPLTFIVIALLLTLIMLLACWIPARRATKVDPMVALRCD
ncbi:MAG TPA: ABC transporter permease [Blastocatellia bacterium]|jgi:putative ABC transport system permease protein|nr:ABC transporter permease [Blastocatellia bacterium]